MFVNPSGAHVSTVGVLGVDPVGSSLLTTLAAEGIDVTTIARHPTVPTPACLVVSRESGQDASLTPLAQIPITLSPVAGMPGTGAAPMLSLPLLLLVALTLVSCGLLLRRRTRVG